METDLRSLQNVLDPTSKQNPKAYSNHYDASHLDYGYIESCSDVDELISLYHVLKSGKEGKWDHLEEFTFNRIILLDPSFAASNKSETSITIPEDLGFNLSDWASELKELDKVARTKKPKKSKKSTQELQYLADNQKLKGNEAYKAKEYQDALDFYSSGLDLLPSPSLYTNRSLTYLKLKLYEKAEEDATHALKFTDISSGLEFKAYMRRGQAWFNLGRFNKALDDFTAALSIDPDSSDAATFKEKTAEKLAVINSKHPVRGEMKRMKIEEVEDTDPLGTDRVSHVAPSAEELSKTSVPKQDVPNMSEKQSDILDKIQSLNLNDDASVCDLLNTINADSNSTGDDNEDKDLPIKTKNVKDFEVTFDKLVDHNKTKRYILLYSPDELTHLVSNISNAATIDRVVDIILDMGMIILFDIHEMSIPNRPFSNFF